MYGKYKYIFFRASLPRLPPYSRPRNSSTCGWRTIRSWTWPIPWQICRIWPWDRRRMENQVNRLVNFRQILFAMYKFVDMTSLIILEIPARFIIWISRSQRGRLHWDQHQERGMRFRYFTLFSHRLGSSYDEKGNVFVISNLSTT